MLYENPFCKYKGLLGEPDTGLRHTFRIFNISLPDVFVVVLVGFLITYITKINIWLVLGVLFLSGIIVHRIFCVKTGMDKYLFPDG